MTGASKGIGLAVARTLAAEGAEVFAGARTVDALAGIERVTAVAVDLVEQADQNGSSARLFSATATSMCSSTTSAVSSCESTGS